MAVNVLNLGPTAWPALPSHDPNCRGDTEFEAAADLPLVSDIQGADTQITRQDTPFDHQRINDTKKETESNIPVDLPLDLLFDPSKNRPSDFSPENYNFEDSAMFTIRQLRDQITANAVAIAALNENMQVLQYPLHAQIIQNQNLVIRNAELEAEIKEVRSAALEFQNTVDADLVNENAKLSAELANVKQKLRLLQERRRSERTSTMTGQGEFLRAPEARTSQLSPLSASFVPAGSVCGREVEEICSSPPEEEAPLLEHGVRWEGASRLERTARREEAWKLRDVRRVERVVEQVAHALWEEDAARWVDLLVPE